MAPRKKVQSSKTAVSLTPTPSRTLARNAAAAAASPARNARTINPGAAPPAARRANQARPAMTINLPTIAIKTVFTNLGSVLKGVIAVNQPPVPLPARILGTLRQPDGTPGGNLELEVLPPSSASASAQKRPAIFGTSTSGSQVLATGLTDSDGNFSMPLPGGIVLPPGESLSIRVRGSSATNVVALAVDPSLLGPLGYVGSMTLPKPLPPIPPAIYTRLLEQLTTALGGSGGGDGATVPSVPKLTLGDDAECIRVLENQASFEQYPYGVFFQLIAPQLYTETETLNADQTGVYQTVTRTDTPVDRFNLNGPISLDDFRNGLLIGPAIVGSLGLGYVLRCSQNWAFQGLALGDLVYSLPLAPGEQQQMVVEEQTTTLVVRETESVYGAETSQASAATDSSTQATFQSAFHQAAQGGSSYNTFSETGAMTVGGGLLGILGGPSGSIGETVSSGSTHNWMDGLQNYASSASQSVQTYAEQQSSAQRRATRTAMRMASASETTAVTTKTITNHNKLHALTMQYFEVLRLFDVSTAYDGVSLVCLVPLDIVWFLPPGQKEHLDDVITDSDVSNAIQYSSELNSALQTMSGLVQMAIAFSVVPFLNAFVQNTVNNVNQQLTAAVTTATALDALLSGLGSGYATQASEAGQLLSQINQAKAAVTLFQPGQVSELQNALSFLSTGVNLATALYQQLSNTSLLTGSMSRQQILDRYQGLLGHSDVLQRWLPSRYASGLTRLEKFASDPRASLVIDSLAEDVIHFSANASVLPFDHVYVAVITRWGSRIGPVEMIPNPPVSVPGQFDNSKAFKTPDDLMQYMRSQRNPGNSSAPRLQATIALPRTLSPTDVLGFEITHSLDSFTYQIATPLDLFTSFFGTNGAAWPGGVLGGIGGLIAPAVTPQAKTYSAGQLAQELGPPFFWNFRADLTASVRGNPESYVRPDSNVVELPPGIYPIPAMEVAPLLKYSDLILIENTLQHVLRNVVLYSKAVWTWMTPEERVMLLEPYLLSFPGITSTVPLLDCVGNEILGFYGNCMMMPFSIPQALGDQQGWPMTTGQLEDALLRFHKQSAPHEIASTMLPTRGVLGEAMLGHCASSEKIDLTRFWNWQDSPADTAPAIAPVSVLGTQVPALATAQGPNQLGAMLPSLINNVNAPAVTPTDALAIALSQKGPAAQFPDMTGSAQLAQLLQSTQTTANQARSDQLAQQTTLTKDAIDQASAVLQAYLTGQSKSSSSENGSSSSSSKSSSGSASSSGS